MPGYSPHARWAAAVRQDAAKLRDSIPDDPHSVVEQRRHDLLWAADAGYRRDWTARQRRAA